MRGWKAWRGAAALAVLTALLAAAPVAAAGSSPSKAAAYLMSGPREGGSLQAPFGAALGPRHARGISDTPSATQPYWGCPEELCGVIIDPSPRAISPTRGRTRALSHFALPDGTLLEGGGELGGLDPEDLQSAYDVPATGGEGQTVALVDALGYPDAESDLAVYRQRYGLPPCTRANGCFRKVNQAGKESAYPKGGSGWESESALDLDMVSAACPHCHILLVEANSANGANLPEAVNTAARLGATEISNSWGGPESECGPDHCESENPDFDHPGVLITSAGGDSGFDDGGESPEWPASNPDVVAVGGTALHRAENARGWTEEAWPHGGSGCSIQAKPAWQADSSCAGRTSADVAAVGACESPLSIYTSHDIGWRNVCGTSASTPILAAIEAHATPFSRTLPGASAFYADPTALQDVSKGSNGFCAPPEELRYLCEAGPGYDGPTGNGSPHGGLDLTAPPPPAAVTKPAVGVSATAATLAGSVAPNGAETTYSFEYGTTTEYGQTTPGGSLTGAGATVSAPVGGLAAATLYHFRVLARNTAGTSYGADEEFVTAVPEVTGVSPASGAAHGGTPVTITGSGVLGTASVKFGPRRADSFTVLSEHEISAHAPVGAGSADVTVTSGAGTSQTGEADRFGWEAAGPDLAWGANKGAFGDNSTAGSDVPVEIDGLPEGVRSLSEGSYASLAVLDDGRVMGWGRNNFSTVGDGTTAFKGEPVPVCAVGVQECPEGPYLEEAIEVAAGAFQSMALLRDGTVATWGTNVFGELGGAGEGEENTAPIPVCMKVETPCQPANYLREVVAIAAGGGFSLALERNGTVLAWGWNGNETLGDGVGAAGPERCGEGTHSGCSSVPIPVKSLTGVRSIAAGFDHALALRENGTVMAWGSGVWGQLGAGKNKNHDEPVAVCPLESLKRCAKKPLQGVVAISATTRDSYALLADGEVAGWGRNGSGQLGDGTERGPETCKSEREQYACSKGPVLVEGLGGVAAIAGGVESTGGLAVTKAGELETWGAGFAGALGNGTTEINATRPHGVCVPYAAGPCPSGPYLSGTVTAMAIGSGALVSLAGSPGG